MLNMIKFDWLGMKCYHNRIIIVPLTICVYGLIHEALVIPIIAFIMLSFSVNPFAVEEKGKLDNLYLTLPVERKDIVKARFGLSILMQLVGLLIGIFATILLSGLFYGRTVFLPHTFKADFHNMLMIICCSLLFYAVMNLSMFPVLFKIGYAKGKAIGFYIPIASVGVIGFVVYMLWFSSSTFRTWVISTVTWAYANMLWTALILVAVAAVLLTISYFISRKVFAKRDF